MVRDHALVLQASRRVMQPGDDAAKFWRHVLQVSARAYRARPHAPREQGQASKELLARHGLADRLLADLEAAVAEFDGSVATSNEGRRSHVGARAALQAVSDEVMRIVEVLDGLNRYRFGGDAEMRAAWESARNVVSEPSAAGEEPAKEGEVKPAA